MSARAAKTAAPADSAASDARQEAEAAAADAARQEAEAAAAEAAEVERLRAEAEASRLLEEAAKAGAASAPAEALDVSEVEIVMLITITGSRNGEPWPHIGKTVKLPAHEAAQMISNGYAALAQ